LTLPRYLSSHVTTVTLALHLHRRTSVQPWKVRPSPIASTGIGVATLLLLGAVVVRHAQKPSTTYTSTQATHRLGLNVEREGQVLLVAWDRGSPSLHNASHAILYIKDGPQQSQLDLNSQQLRAANVKYWPETQKVSFMLEVYQGDGSISESAQVTGAADPAGEPASVVAAQPTRPNVASGSLAANASTEPARPSPFALRTQREIRPEPSISLATPAHDPQPPRTFITAAATPPPSVAEMSDQRSRLARMVSKIPLLRRLKKHPENEYPLR
jgi:hypothetical protein